MSPTDEAFDALPLRTSADAALSEAQDRGCAYADVRIERIRNQSLSLRDLELERATDDVELGISVRVVWNGSIGFASGIALGGRSAVDLVNGAIDVAKLTNTARSRLVELAPEPVHEDVRWTSRFDLDPAEVPLTRKLERLQELSARLLESATIDHVESSVHCVDEDKFFASLAGTTATQRRVRVHPVIEAYAHNEDGSFETMRTLAPPVGRGWEYLEGTGWDFDDEIARIPELLREKLSSASVEPGNYDLVIDPTNLWLTIHESIGHATELDRALGYEAAYAGTSFATPDLLGVLQYGSPLLHITGDRTTPHGLATVAIDDEGVEAQSFDIVKDGILVGYQLDRGIAAEFGSPRSNGCAFASGPSMIPIQRMANVSLAPAANDNPSIAELVADVENGIYILGDKSWSIDMQRHNFQFTGQRFFKIEHGELKGQLKDVAYQSNTTEFWGALDGLGGRSTYLLGGAFNCGKGQPGQTAPVSHGSPAALFRQIRVLNARLEANR